MKTNEKNARREKKRHRRDEKRQKSQIGRYRFGAEKTTLALPPFVPGGPLSAEDAHVFAAFPLAEEPSVVRVIFSAIFPKWTAEQKDVSAPRSGERAGGKEKLLPRRKKQADGEKIADSCREEEITAGKERPETFPQTVWISGEAADRFSSFYRVLAKRLTDSLRAWANAGREDPGKKSASKELPDVSAHPAPGSPARGVLFARSSSLNAGRGVLFTRLPPEDRRQRSVPARHLLRISVECTPYAEGCAPGRIAFLRVERVIYAGKLIRERRTIDLFSLPDLFLLPAPRPGARGKPGNNVARARKASEK